MISILNMQGVVFSLIGVDEPKCFEFGSLRNEIKVSGTSSERTLDT